MDNSEPVLGRVTQEGSTGATPGVGFRTESAAPVAPQSLVAWVDERLQTSGLSEESALLVLAALDGDELLDSYLDEGTPVQRPRESSDAEVVPANGVVLTSIRVEGFRGIGPESELRIAPKPGLTVVVGRNGSGKSSFSEALELVLTGGTYRWANKGTEWRDHWRNLHHPTARISIGLVEEGVGPISVTSTWANEQKAVDGRVVRAQVKGEPQVDGIDHLGWKTALEQFRPILSYEELGGMLEGKQSDLYDALASILGVEQVSDAVKRLKARSTVRKGPCDVATTRRKELQKWAAGSTDSRAVKAAALLRKSDPDTSALRAIATGSPQVDQGPVNALRLLAAIAGPDQGILGREVTQLRVAKNELADAGASVSQRKRDRLRLLEAGLRLHANHGDQTCPICHVGELDAPWAESSRLLAENQKAEFEGVELAHQTFEIAFDSLSKCLEQPPSTLKAAPVTSLQGPVDDARIAWAVWARAAVSRDAAGADDLIQHVESALPILVEALDNLREAARTRMAELDDEWQPLAGAIAGWCDDWESWKVAEPVVSQLQSAAKWLTDSDLALKNERLAPIETEARKAWERLRQESNIDLGTLKLTGSNTSRRLRVSGAIDGQPVDSFAVFSQGELHALALSLFLPRATLAESPFRFVVLDDPVQAMDPAKVDGLVELLGALGKTRQVLVFSHDDRLPAALRRSSYDATILEVGRGSNSVVSVSTSQNPTTRYLDDAHGLIMEWRSDKLTEEDLRRTLPGLFRFAIESAAKDRYFETRLKAGASIHELERTWSDTHATKRRVNLAIFGEQPAEHEAQAWANLAHRKAALGVAAGGFHKGLASWASPDDAHHNAKRLVDDIRCGSK